MYYSKIGGLIMRNLEFKKWMMGRKRLYNGKLDYYSETAVDSRIACLKRLEELALIKKPFTPATLPTTRRNSLALLPLKTFYFRIKKL